MADDKTKISYDTKAMDEILAMLKKADKMALRVGIIGSQAKKQHKGDGKQSITNATLGTFHEFGSEKIPNHPPRRSFLEDSLKFRLKFDSEEFKGLRKNLFTQFFDKKAPQKFLAELGKLCIQFIHEGFETNGYGAWKSYSQAYWAKRNKVSEGKAKRASTKLERSWDYWMSHSMLNVTGQLKNSILFKIIKKQ